MKTPWPWIFSSCLPLLLLASLARAADPEAAPRLTVELRDGSRVVGTSVAKQFKLHSDLLGDLKLDVKDIRAVDCVSTNSAKLTTVSGDSLTVSFVEPDLAVNTSFGKVNLALPTVRKFSVSGGAGAALSGLAAMWSADGNGKSSVGDCDAQLRNVSVVADSRGPVFSFNGFSSYLRVPACPSIKAGPDKSLTFMAWIRPERAFGETPIFEFERELGTYNGSDVGVSSAFSVGPPSGTGPGCVMANVVDTGGNSHILSSVPGLLVGGYWQHVALTYDGTSGMANIYLNGKSIAQSNLGQFDPQTGFDLIIGARTTFGSAERPSRAFQGEMDKICFYSRALSGAEVESACRDGNNGELPTVPPEMMNPGRMPRYPNYGGGFGQ